MRSKHRNDVYMSQQQIIHLWCFLSNSNKSSSDISYGVVAWIALACVKVILMAKYYDATLACLRKSSCRIVGVVEGRRSRGQTILADSVKSKVHTSLTFVLRSKLLW
jgi:hypothetical protein